VSARASDRVKQEDEKPMAVVRGSGGGRLNPWAEPFVPSGVRYRGLQTAEAAPEQEVEDFSPEWWRLVSASPAFRDRWLREYGALGLLDTEEDLDDDAEVDDFFSPPAPRQGKPPCASQLHLLICLPICDCIFATRNFGTDLVYRGIRTEQRASGRTPRPGLVRRPAEDLKWRRGASTSGGGRTGVRRRPRGTRRRRRGG
jgi:hypothetical protein